MDANKSYSELDDNFNKKIKMINNYDLNTLNKLIIVHDNCYNCWDCYDYDLRFSFININIKCYDKIGIRCDIEDYTPLMYAVKWYEYFTSSYLKSKILEIIKLLINKGVDITPFSLNFGTV